MRMRQNTRLIVVSVTTLFFTVPAHSQELRKIRVGIPTLSPIIAATLVPRDKGYFKQEGLDVETIVIRSAPSVLALAAKEIDFLLTGGGGLSGALRGLPLRVVFAPLRRQPTRSTPSRRFAPSPKSKANASAYRTTAADPICCCAMY